MRKTFAIALSVIFALALCACQSPSPPAQLLVAPVAQIPPLPTDLVPREPNLRQRLLCLLSESPATATTPSGTSTAALPPTTSCETSTMLKPSSLRKFLTAATPELARDPDKLTISVPQGRLVAAGAASISFEYRYTLRLVVMDYSAHPDAIVVPLMAWLRVNQPEIMDNPALRESAVRFETDFLNNESVDFQIDIDLTERVIVQRPADTPQAPSEARWVVQHPDEPERIGDFPIAEHWRVEFPEGTVIAEWDYPTTF